MDVHHGGTEGTEAVVIAPREGLVTRGSWVNVMVMLCEQPGIREQVEAWEREQELRAELWRFGL